MKRVSIHELSISRIFYAILRRISTIPFKLTWEFSTMARSNKDKLKNLKNIHKGQRCYLVANGPSLRKMDLSFLDNKISFGLNRIYLAYKDYNFVNTYLVSINDLVLSQFSEEFKNLNLIKFVKWNKHKLFKNSNNFLFIYNRFFGSPFSKNISKSLNPAATVTYAALQIIYYMGFSEVVIIGMDHNFVSRSKIPNTTETRTEDIDSNHFDPNYFPKGLKWDTPDLVSSEYFYSIANNKFINDNRKIIDCTVGGKCNVFQKGEIKNYI